MDFNKLAKAHYATGFQIMNQMIMPISALAPPTADINTPSLSGWMVTIVVCFFVNYAALWLTFNMLNEVINMALSALHQHTSIYRLRKRANMGPGNAR